MLNLKRISLLAVAGFALAACAAQNYQPVIDPYGVDMGRYQADLASCRALAEQVDATGDTAENALIGAGVGAAGGAALGALSGDAGIGAATGAVIGAFGAGGASGIEKNQRQKTIINNCLKGRGYKILG